VIAIHGHRGARHHCVGIGAALWRKGANVLLFDHRGRGTSEGDLMSLDYYEVFVALTAIGYSLSRAPEVPLGPIGYSMGAAVAVMAAARDERVRAIVADSPFASERDLVRFLLRACLVKVRVKPFVAFWRMRRTYLMALFGRNASRKLWKLARHMLT
jgi:uncharacterized protein